MQDSLHVLPKAVGSAVTNETIISTKWFIIEGGLAIVPMINPIPIIKT